MTLEFWTHHLWERQLLAEKENKQITALDDLLGPMTMDEHIAHAKEEVTSSTELLPDEKDFAFVIKG